MSPELRAELLSVLAEMQRDLERMASGVWLGSYWPITQGRLIAALRAKLQAEQA